MKLDEVNHEILAMQKLAVSDVDGALGLLKRMLVHLMEDDAFFVLAAQDTTQEQKGSFLPYISAVRDLPYLRAFSSMDAADHFLETAAYPVIQLNTIDMVKLCKYWMLMGVEGFILNDGQEWTAVSFSQFLSLFYMEVLDHSGSMESDFLPLVATAKNLLAGEKLYVGKDGLLTGEDGTELNMEDPPEMKLVLDGEPTTVSRLKRIYDDMKAMRLGKDFTEKGFLYSLPVSSSYPYAELDPELVIREPEDIKAKSEKLSLSKLREKLPKLKLPKGGGSKPHLPRHFKGIAAAVVLLCIGIYLATAFMSNLRFENLCDEREYQEATSYYLSHTFLPFTKNKLSDSTADKILEGYHSGDLAPEEARAGLSILGSIPEFTEDMHEGIVLIDSLEQSRMAYQNGAASTQSLERLAYWMAVIPEDESNYALVQGDVPLNKDRYSAAGTRAIDALIQSGKRGQAKWGLKVLQYWYPESGYEERLALMSDVEEISLLTAHDLTGGEVSTSLLPIEIYDIDVTKADSDGYVDLYIEWKNTGTKTIQEIMYYVVPLDGLGGQVSSKRDGGYSVYCARDIGPYKPGEGTPTESWAWKDAWSNSMIKAAEIQQIVIFYEDGSMKNAEDVNVLIM